MLFDISVKSDLLRIQSKLKRFESTLSKPQGDHKQGYQNLQFLDIFQRHKGILLDQKIILKIKTP